MTFMRTAIPEVVMIDPKIHGDERGYFVETFRQEAFEHFIGYRVNFCQDNESRSHHGVLRGLHYQLPPFAQSKLVRVIDGRVLDVAVDIRVGSPTFGKHVAVELSGKNKRQMFIPRGFAHGFVVLSETCTFMYKVDNYYAPECDRGIAFDDKDLNIDWQLSTEALNLSLKDTKQPKLCETLELFEYKVNYYA